MKKKRERNILFPLPLRQLRRFLSPSEAVNLQVTVLRLGPLKCCCLPLCWVPFLKPNCYKRKNLKNTAAATIAVLDVDPSPSEVDHSPLESKTSLQRSLWTTGSFSVFFFIQGKKEQICLIVINCMEKNKWSKGIVSATRIEVLFCTAL